MKRILVYTLVLALLFCGCSKPEGIIPTTETITEVDNVTTPEAEAPTEATNSTEVQLPEFTQQPMVAVSLPLIHENTSFEDDVIFKYDYQSIHITVQDQEVADRIIIDFLNRQDQAHDAADSFRDYAVQKQTSIDPSTPYFYKALYSPTRLDHSVLSLFSHSVIFTGSRHPEYECVAANYNMTTGEILTLGSILYDIEADSTLCELVISHMDAFSEEKYLYDDYKDFVYQRFDRDESFDQDWYFSESGLCFFFAPYEVAPYTTGVVTVEVPYEDLTGILADAFFPAEEDLSQGTVHASFLQDVNTTEITQIAEIILDPEGEAVMLSCDGLVRNVHIDYGYWDETGTIYTADATVFATYTLSPGDGIMLKTYIPDVMPNLRLTYTTGDQTIVKYIHQSGIDGSILLLDM